MKTALGKLALAGKALSLFLLTLPTSARADLLIDSFDISQSSPGGVDTRNVVDGSGILGGERDILSYLQLSINGTHPGQLRAASPIGLFMGPAASIITYDGDDNNPSGSYFGGLGSIDLTQGGINDRFRFDIASIVNFGAALRIEVRSPFYGSSVQLNLPQTPGPFDVSFSSFQFDGSPFTYPANFHSIGYISFSIILNPGSEVVLDRVITTVPEPSALALVFSSVGLLFFVRRK